MTIDSLPTALQMLRFVYECNPEDGDALERAKSELDGMPWAWTSESHYSSKEAVLEVNIRTGEYGVGTINELIDIVLLDIEIRQIIARHHVRLE